jgi:hypothetical protein
MAGGHRGGGRQRPPPTISKAATPPAPMVANYGRRGRFCAYHFLN